MAGLVSTRHAVLVGSAWLRVYTHIYAFAHEGRHTCYASYQTDDTCYIRITHISKTISYGDRRLWHKHRCDTMQIAASGQSLVGESSWL